VRSISFGGDRPSHTVYFNFVYSPSRNVDDEIAGIFVIASDVTDQGESHTGDAGRDVVG
jgi:hypothetical protein